MAEKKTKKEKEKPTIDVEVGAKGLLGGFFKGLESLIDLADQVTRAGGKIEKTGEFGIQGQKDMTGVYGFTIRTMEGPGGAPRPVVRPFGNVAKVKKTQRPKGPIVEEAREPIVDLFDEKEFVRIVAELPGVSESEIITEVQGDDVLQIEATGPEKYLKEVYLPAKVIAASLEKNYTNGVLEVKLQKKQ